MKTYQTLHDGALASDDWSYIPVDTGLYIKALAEVEAGESEILPYQAPSLKELKEKAINSVEQFATKARSQIAQNADSIKIVGWSELGAAAKAYRDGSADEDQLAFLETERAERKKNETLDELVDKIITNRKRYLHGLAKVSGMESASITAIESKQKESTLATLMETLLVDAEAELKALLEANQ